MRIPAITGTQIGVWLIFVDWRTVSRGSCTATGYREEWNLTYKQIGQDSCQARRNRQQSFGRDSKQIGMST